ncbi:GrpB family protein [Lachnospiraceae bacterium 29-84]
MKKELSEMSKEELWELFPIALVPHTSKWKLYYNEMEILLKDILSKYAIERISHIGSTAISGIWAKDIVDILVEVTKNTEIENAAREIEKNGFIRMSTKKNRISLNFGYTKKGFTEKVFHIHLRYRGDNDELYFRDYLNENPKIAKEYEKLKLKLWKLYEYNRDAYTDSKTEFIRKYTNEAKKLYQNRYY